MALDLDMNEAGSAGSEIRFSLVFGKDDCYDFGGDEPEDVVVLDEVFAGAPAGGARFTGLRPNPMSVYTINNASRSSPVSASLASGYSPASSYSPASTELAGGTPSPDLLSLPPMSSSRLSMAASKRVQLKRSMSHPEELVI
eukprot:TRINITY_DN2239_c0_g1_i1.p1 TRINITY_DN2239_c0_g1~~TRINITY_DN2239_c0_g1_i1.p1  ORF type:complete len:142 (+),score=19.17 TRINITY_DN2239_c0_g1_i1:89-514(+)